MQPGGIHAAEPAVKFEKLCRGEPLIEAKIFRKKSNFAADLHVPGRLPEDEGLAAARIHQPQQHLDGRALAGAVGTEKPKNFAAAYAQRQIPHSDLVAKGFAQVPRFNGQTIWQIQGVLERWR